MVITLARIATNWGGGNMINENEEISVNSNFVLDMNCDTKHGKTLRCTFKQKLGVSSMANSNYYNKGKLLRIMEEVNSVSKDALTK